MQRLKFFADWPSPVAIALVVKKIRTGQEP